MALEITRGLFGVEVPESSDQDFKDAVTYAQLSPEQAVRASGMMSGTMLGRGVGNLARAGVGLATGADVRSQEEKRQMAGMRAMANIKQAGIDPDSPEQYLPIVIRAFQEEGLLEDALKSAALLQQFKQTSAKTSSEVMKNQAAAVKDLDAVSLGGKAAELARTGKFVPTSLAKFAKTGKFEDLQLEEAHKNDYIELDTKDGIKLVPKTTAADRSTWINAGAKRTDITADERLLGRWKELLNKATSDDGTLNYNNLTAAELAEMKGVASNDKVLGKQGARAFFNDLNIDLGVEESKALSSVIRGDVFNKQFTELSKSWLPGSDPKAFTAWFTAMKEAGDKGVDATTAQALFKDPATARYVSSAIRFINAILRRESGAAVTESEWQRYGVGYIPMPGDGPEAIREKEIARNIWLQSEQDSFTPAMKNLWDKRKTKGDTQPEEPVNDNKPVNSEALISKAKSLAGPANAAARAAWLATLSPAEKKVLEPYMKKGSK